MAGFILLYRDFERNPMFQPGPFCEPMAWVWLLSAAAHRPMRTRVASHVIALQRGQLGFSIRFLGEKWGWDKAKVHRFLRRLESETAIETHCETGVTVITICNYDKYQVAKKSGETPDETPDDTDARQTRDKEERIKRTKESLSAENGPPKAKKRSYEEHLAFPEFWSIYPARQGGSDRKRAAKHFSSWVRNGESPDDILRGTKAYADDMQRQGNVGTKYVKDAANFLSGEGWRRYLDGSNVVQFEPWRTDPASWSDQHNPPPWPDAPSGTKAGGWMKTPTTWVRAR